MQPVLVARPQLFERFSAAAARDERLGFPTPLRNGIVAVAGHVDRGDGAT